MAALHDDPPAAADSGIDRDFGDVHAARAFPDAQRLAVDERVVDALSRGADEALHVERERRAVAERALLRDN